jgi:hypothetical protein
LRHFYQDMLMTDNLQPQFTEVLIRIKTAEQEVIATANQELIKLYWSIDKYNSETMLKKVPKLRKLIKAKKYALKY